MKIALVQDFITRLGGAERVLSTLSQMFPEAPIYTLLYDEEKVGATFPKERIRSSWLQKLPAFIRKRHKYLLTTMPRAVESWDFSEFDIVISSNTAFVHGIITPTTTTHISYYHSPMRSLWDWTNEYKKEQKISGWKSPLLAYLLKKLRVWDYMASDRADISLANSKNVQQRIEKYYRKPSRVVYPPIDLSKAEVSKKSEDYFLIISTLTPYKRIELAIQLFNKIGKKLVVIGDGPHRDFLEYMAGDNIEFKGFLSDKEAIEYLRNCRALIFPGEEDFGITPVEAMACGKPVLAYGKGGVRESVIAGKTGEFFKNPTVASMEEALARLMKHGPYDPDLCRKRAEEFSEERFIKEIMQVIAEAKQL